LEQLVHGRGDAVQTPLQHDLARQVVGLDRLRRANDALPRRSAAKLTFQDRPDAQQLYAPGRILFALDEGIRQPQLDTIESRAGQIVNGLFGNDWADSTGERNELGDARARTVSYRAGAMGN
jgi:hypothetical protein